MNIEPVLKESQIEIVEELAREIWNEYFVPIIGRAQVDYMLAKFQSKKAISGQIGKGFLYYLIRVEDNFVGYFGIHPKEDELFLSKIYIRSSERNKGYGRTAVRFLEDIAEQKRLGKITLRVNKNNSDTIRAYERFGFRNLGSVVQDIGNGFVMDDYKMEKILQ